MSSSTKKRLPFVSVCTPTFNRRPFIPIMLECFRNQDYPNNRLEWIIADDGTDTIEDLIENSGNIRELIKYIKIEKMPLGKKRNFLHKQCKGDIIVYMDDDDYYPPERISHAVGELLKNPTALCAGSSELYVYFKNHKKMIQFGPYGPNHATAGTFAFRKELLEQTQYNDERSVAEEREFLKNYTIPFVQLNPLKTILVFSHLHNSVNKEKFLENPNSSIIESDKTIEMFIRGEKEELFKKFFLEDIDDLLLHYDPGHPNNKPEVLEQIRLLDEERKKMQEQLQQQQTQIILEQPGQQSIVLNQQQIIKIIQEQQTVIQKQHKAIEELQAGNILIAQGDAPPITLTHSQIVELLQHQQTTIENMKKSIEEKDTIIQQLQIKLISI